LRFSTITNFKPPNSTGIHAAAHICASAVQFVVNGRTLRIAWPQVGDFEERVLNADQRDVVGVVVSAGKYQEGLSGYAPTAGAGR
jgi:hypothetical protein